MLILVVVILVLVREAADPLSTVFFLLLLEDLHLDSGKGDLNGTGLATDDLAHSDSLVDFIEHLNILIHVNVDAPAVCNAEEHLLKHSDIHSLLAAGIPDPLLGHFAVHLLLSVKR